MTVTAARDAVSAAALAGDRVALVALGASLPATTAFAYERHRARAYAHALEDSGDAALGELAVGAAAMPPSAAVLAADGAGLHLLLGDPARSIAAIGLAARTRSVRRLRPCRPARLDPRSAGGVAPRRAGSRARPSSARRARRARRCVQRDGRPQGVSHRARRDGAADRARRAARTADAARGRRHLGRRRHRAQLRGAALGRRRPQPPASRRSSRPRTRSTRSRRSSGARRRS